jgi:ElaB/YqjD/DUF883 family membrane-anchored ribosome-binding protein
MRTKTGNGQLVNFDRLMEDIKTVVHDGEALLKSGAKVVQKQALAGAKRTDKIVHRHPYPTMGLVFAVGVLVGVLGTRACLSEQRDMEEY